MEIYIYIFKVSIHLLMIEISYLYIFKVAIPLLVMGTKMDSAQEKRGLPTHQKR